MDDRELELDSGEGNGSANQEVRKNIPLKLKSGGRGRGRGRGRRKSSGVGRGRKKKVDIEEDEMEGDMVQQEQEHLPPEMSDSHHRADDFRDFEPMDVKPTGPPEPTKLNWDHKVNLIGEKVVDPLIHCCEKCTLPILIYGRMLPCRHVFCFDCAKQTEKTCPRCKETVTRIEQSALGTVFVCTFGGSKHGTGGCRRTYLSQRDLQAHIKHRHSKQIVDQPPSEQSSRIPGQAESAPATYRRPEDPRRAPEDPRRMVDDPRRLAEDPRQRMEDPRQQAQPHPFQTPVPQGLVRQQVVNQQGPPQASDTFSIPVMSSRGSNLISVPIQDEARRDYGQPAEPTGNYHRQQPAPMAFDGHQHFSQGPPIRPPVVSPQYSTAGQPPPVSFAGPPINHPGGPPINHPGGPPIHHGGPPPRWAGDRPITSQFSQTSGHSPNMTWSGQPNRGPPPNMPPTSAQMGPPRGQYYQ